MFCEAAYEVMITWNEVEADFNCRGENLALLVVQKEGNKASRLG
jgi:hypothetical protein